MKRCFLVSKRFGLSLLKSIEPDLNDTCIIHPNDSHDDRSIISEFQEFSRKVGSELNIVSTPSEAQKCIQRFSPDVMLVCGWYWLISNELLASVPSGVFGIHNSLLPKFRGGSPLVWSMISGEPVIGSSMFRIEDGMDDGAIVAQVKINNEPDLTISMAMEKIESMFCDKFPEIWKTILDDTLCFIPQNHKNATYCAQRIPEDGHINWNWSPIEIHNFVRAQSFPYPGAYSFLEDKKIVIEETKISSQRIYATPGQVLNRNQNGYVGVACGQMEVIDILRLRGDVQHPKSVIKSLKVRLL